MHTLDEWVGKLNSINQNCKDDRWFGFTSEYIIIHAQIRSAFDRLIYHTYRTFRSLIQSIIHTTQIYARTHSVNHPYTHTHTHALTRTQSPHSLSLPLIQRLRLVRLTTAQRACSPREGLGRRAGMGGRNSVSVVRWAVTVRSLAFAKWGAESTFLWATNRLFLYMSSSSSSSSSSGARGW